MGIAAEYLCLRNPFGLQGGGAMTYASLCTLPEATVNLALLQIPTLRRHHFRTGSQHCQCVF